MYTYTTVESTLFYMQGKSIISLTMSAIIHVHDLMCMDKRGKEATVVLFRTLVPCQLDHTALPACLLCSWLQAMGERRVLGWGEKSNE